MSTRQSIKPFLLLVPFVFLFFAINSFAHDTDLYTAGGEGVKPNILFIIDNSCSMEDNADAGNNYDASTAYPPDLNYPTINKDYVYEYTGSWDQTLKDLKVFKASISLVECSTARSKLSTNGVYYNGYTDSGCRDRKTIKTLATGNYLNFYLSYNGVVGKMPKIDIAKKVLTNLLEDLNGVNVGVEIFNPDGDGGKVISWIKDVDIDTNRQQLIKDVNAIVNKCGTPLAKALYEGGLYFQGKPSYFCSPLDYKNVNPIQYSCQKNFVILMSDGMANSDDCTPLRTYIGDQDKDGKEPGDPDHFLDDVAKYFYDNDLNSSLEGKQNVLTYTIGFLNDSAEGTALLTRAATNGHGKFYTSSNALNLAGAFTSIINEVLAKTSSFVAPIVPVSKMERTTAGDKIYLAFFKPKQGGMWSGNIKKYGVAQQKDPSEGIEVGDILDVSGSKALDSNGEFYAATKSYWTTSSSDGGEVERGGVGEVLRSRTSARKIYTYLETNSNLTDSSNAFTIANSSITATLLGVASGDRDKLINFVHGIDSWDDNLNGSTTDRRDWFLGSFLHSRPFIIHYSGRTLIYAGSNDGMLHAFDDSNGEELWAFIPPNLLGRLSELHTATLGIFVDGSPKAYVSYNSDGKTVNKAILIFGLRRGGNKYHALDVTDPVNPKYAWKIDPDTMSDYAEMGQSWSTPAIGKIADGTGEKWVAFIGGGYDTGEDLDLPPADQHGRAVYVVDMLTGSLVKRFSHAEHDDMDYCIPSDIAKLDMDGDGKIDRLYVGGMNARMWRFDIGIANSTGSWTGKVIFESNRGDSERRKIFYPPDVTFERENGADYEMLFFGTGDRENPKEMKVGKDRLYAVKDRNSETILQDSDLVDLTLNLLQDPNTDRTTKNEILNSLKTKSGWFIKLDTKAGEKCLSSPVVYYKTAYFTTFSPTTGSDTDPCFIGEGTGTLYAVKYDTGEAVFNLDLTNDVGGTVVKRSDRSIQIGTAIPSGVVMTVVGGKVTAYIGVGGGVHKPTLSSTKTLFPVTWKLVF